MSKRNYRNERYTTDDGKKGVAKKSASKAKVAREAASTVYVKDSNAKKSKKQIRYEERLKEEKRKQIEERRYNRVAGPGAKDSLERTKDQTKSKRYRKYWWVFLVAAAVCAFAAHQTQGTSVFYVFIALSYGFVVVAIVLEFWKIRKARNEEERLSEEKLTTKRIKHEIEAQKEERDKKMLKRFKKQQDLADDLPFKE